MAPCDAALSAPRATPSSLSPCGKVSLAACVEAILRASPTLGGACRSSRLLAAGDLCRFICPSSSSSVNWWARSSKRLFKSDFNVLLLPTAGDFARFARCGCSGMRSLSILSVSTGEVRASSPRTFAACISLPRASARRVSRSPRTCVPVPASASAGSCRVSSLAP